MQPLFSLLTKPCFAGARRPAPLVMIGALMLMSGMSASAATLTVSNINNTGAGSLRAQVAAAAAGDTVDFAAGLTGQIEMAAPTIAINKNLTIIGPGAGVVTIDGNNATRMFRVEAGVVSISGLTMDRGSANSEPAVTANGLVNVNRGGAINLFGGALSVANCVFSNNAGADGGAIYGASGTSLTVATSTFSANRGGRGGGGAIQMAGGTLLMTDCTVAGNRSTDGVGGGFYLMEAATATIKNTSVSGNMANTQFGGGGGIFNLGNLTITQSTISGNSTPANFSTIIDGGGGIYNGGTLAVSNCTLTANSALNGGGINTRSNPLTLSNTIVAANTATNGPDIYGNAVAGDYNLVGNVSGSSVSGANNIFNQPALLGALTDNGGPTKTHALSVGSPAIGAGDPAFNATGTPNDQRGVGFARVQSGRIDIGAYEAETSQSGSNFVVNTLADTDDGVCGPTNCTLREAVKTAPADAVISFSVSGVITLTGGEMVIAKNLSIQGPTTAPGITVSGNNLSRIFSINSGVVNLSLLTLSGGNTGGSAGTGGAIFIGGGVVTIASSTLSGNRSTGSGGALSLSNAGSALTVTGSTFSGNSSGNSGGAINHFSGTSVSIFNSTFSGNSALNNGGAIRCLATLTIANTSISGNSITSTTSLGGGGLHNNGGTLNLSNTIVAGNSATNSPDLFGVVSSGGYNLVQNISGATLSGTGNITGQAANIGTLGNNGGPTATFALLTGSPALNKGSNALVPSDVTTDGRGAGFARIQGASVDIGAFEVQPPTVTTPTSANITATTATLGGNVTADNGFAITERGVVYAPTGTNADPLIGGTVVVKATTTGTTGVFTVALTGLTPSTAYSFKAYATSSIGTNYTSVATFTTTPPDPTGAAGLVVTTNSDVSANDGLITLREAVAYANSGSAGTAPEITFSVTGTIQLGNVGTRDLVVNNNLTITGPGAGSLTVKAAVNYTVFEIRSGMVSISGLTLSDGEGNEISTYNPTTGVTTRRILGGAIYITGGTVTLTSCTLSNNTAEQGGAIYMTNGSLTIASSILSDNSSYTGNGGGGIFILSGSLLMTDTSISGNTAFNGSGGGVNLNTNTTATVTNSTISGNRGTSQAGGGGGFFNNGGNLTIINSTITGNSTTAYVNENTTTDGGGGIMHLGGQLMVANSTVTGNTAPMGGGIHSYSNRGLNLWNSIVAGNNPTGYYPDLGKDIYGSVLAGDYNLVQDISSATLTGTHNITGQDALLGALANNGGSTQTHALLAGSPAINAGSNALIPSGVTTDGRGVGFPRIVGTTVDIGAFEVQQTNAAPVFDNSSYQFVFTLNRPISGAKVSATDAEGEALTYSLSGGALPNGVTFNTDGSFSGTPSATSSPITRTVTVNDGTSTATASVTLSVSSGGGAIISEFRFRGVATGDQYVELYNTTGAPLNISGWSIRTDTGGGITQPSVVPAGTVVPAYGHFLFTGTGYSLTGYSASDASLGAIAADDSGVALFNAVGEVQDAAGFAGSLSTLREGTGLASAPNSNGTATSQSAFMRRFKGQSPVDTDDNAADFLLLTTDGLAVAGTSIAPQLGAPNPEGLASPVNINAQIGVRVLDANFGPNVAPNRVRNGSGNGGSLVFRRIIKNNTGQPLSRIRLLITDITGQVSPVVAGQADVRVTSQADENVAVAGQGTVLVYGTTLEAPSNLPSGTGPTTVGGGGIGSSVNYDIVLTTPLAVGAERPYTFNVQVAKTGSFFVNINLLGK